MSINFFNSLDACKVGHGRLWPSLSPHTYDGSVKLLVSSISDGLGGTERQGLTIIEVLGYISFSIHSSM
jgi:hypothetical protein